MSLITLDAEAAVAGRDIRAYRIKNDLTQLQLSTMLGVSVPTLSRWENGKRMAYPRLVRLALGALDAGATFPPSLIALIEQENAA